jgi:hypothetical protein
MMFTMLTARCYDHYRQFCGPREYRGYTQIMAGIAQDQYRRYVKHAPKAVELPRVTPFGG